MFLSGLNCCKDLAILPSVIVYLNSVGLCTFITVFNYEAAIQIKDEDESVVGGNSQEVVRMVQRVSEKAKSNLSTMGSECNICFYYRVLLTFKFDFSGEIVVGW